MSSVPRPQVPHQVLELTIRIAASEDVSPTRTDPCSICPAVDRARAPEPESLLLLRARHRLPPVIE